MKFTNLGMECITYFNIETHKDIDLVIDTLNKSQLMRNYGLKIEKIEDTRVKILHDADVDISKVLYEIVNIKI